VEAFAATLGTRAEDLLVSVAMVATAKQAAQGEITTLLGRGAAFEGKLTFDGTVRIDGRFKGEVFSDDVLVIGENAHVEAEIDIGEVIVQGTVVGNIKAKRSIEIHAPGRVKGDLHSPSLQIDKGVIFEGRSFMENAVTAQPRPASPAAPAAPKPGPTPVKP
jgi:cytoskeletal protein CcmA (bactofilin family)